MTSRLRRKRQITARIIRRATSTNQHLARNSLLFAFTIVATTTVGVRGENNRPPLLFRVSPNVRHISSSNETPVSNDATDVDREIVTKPKAPIRTAVRWTTGGDDLPARAVVEKTISSYPVSQASGAWTIRSSQKTARAILPRNEPAPIVADEPFEDPFGDRIRKNSQSVFSTALQPPANDSSDDFSADDDSADPMPRQADPADDDPLDNPFQDDNPQPRIPDADDLGYNEVPCDRVYNDRNCCAEDDKCREAWDSLRMPITRISLDITPKYDAVGIDRGAAEVARIQKMERSPTRRWKNRAGETLAYGRMTDLQNSNVLVVIAEGKIERLPFWELSDDDLCFVTAWWDLPTECSLGYDSYAGRNFIPSTLTWKASALCHKPLYFEEVQLERYGHTAGPLVQPVVSHAHFFMNIATLPYQMGINPPNECRYALGYYRPGSCAPWLVPPVPLSLRGALYQTGAVLGGIYALP